MRTAFLTVVATVATVAVATVSTVGCGDASSSTAIRRNRGVAAIPDDPSEEPGAIPDQDDPANPNSSTPPAAPATPGTTTGEIGVTLSTATPQTDLGTSIDITVTVEPKGGFKGEAALTATGLPAGVVATFSPASVTLNTTAATSKLTVQVPYGTLPSAQDAASALVVKATSGAIAATANASFKVNPKVTLTIPVNSAALLAAGGGAKLVDGWGGPMFGSSAAPLQTQAGNGITFIVKNADSTARTVHGSNGFPHGDVAVAPGQTDPKTRVLNPATANINASGYLHGVTNGTCVGFKVTVNKAP